MKKKVLVIGGGAAGMMAAIFAARNGNGVMLLEKNEKLGKKLFITGKGRCNLTNACDNIDLFANILTNSKFLYSSFYTFSNAMTIQFFEEIGLPLKIERGNRVFPTSDKSSDVISALTKELKRQKVKILLNHTVDRLSIDKDRVQGVYIKESDQILSADSVIVATGGLSYPSTGSTGDGYRFAKELEHTVTELSPSLVPLLTKEDFIKDLQGLSLKNVSVIIKAENKEVFHDFGEMLFTHFGVSGPLMLSASSQLKKYIGSKDLSLHIDLKPALSFEQLEERVLRDFQLFPNSIFKNGLNKLLPKKMIPVIITLSGISRNKPLNQITKEERKRLLSCMKDFQLTVVGMRGYSEAVITKGGVSVKEINPSTMESKKCKGVYFVGEVLDLDALTGGFNLQIAWSTAYLAGISI